MVSILLLTWSVFQNPEGKKYKSDILKANTVVFSDEEEDTNDDNCDEDVSENLFENLLKRVDIKADRTVWKSWLAEVKVVPASQDNSSLWVLLRAEVLPLK